MRLEYSLDADDYLQYQLFSLSHNKTFKAKRARATFIIAGGLFFIGVLSYDSSKKESSIAYFTVGIMILLFYPLAQRFLYKKAYEKQILERYKTLFGKTTILEIEEESMEAKDASSELKMPLNEIDGITETGNYFFMAIKRGSHIIIPKRKLPNVTKVKVFFHALCKRLNVQYREELNWKWK